MIYIQKGLASAKMDEVRSPHSDFETVSSFKPIVISPEDKTKEITLPNGARVSKAKGSLSYYFIAGQLRNNKRSNETVVSRSLVALDYDSIHLDLEEAKTLVTSKIGHYSYFLYPTVSHAKGNTRFRIIIDCERSMNRGEYEATLQEIASLIGLPFDSSSLTYSQMMALPITDNLEAFKQEIVINHGTPYPVESPRDSRYFKRENGIESKERIFPNGGKGRVILLLEEVVNGIPEGGRNSFFAKAFGILLKANMETTEAIQLCVDWNEMYCTPPMTEGELFAVIRSILSRESSKAEGRDS